MHAVCVVYGKIGMMCCQWLNNRTFRIHVHLVPRMPTTAGAIHIHWQAMETKPEQQKVLRSTFCMQLPETGQSQYHLAQVMGPKPLFISAGNHTYRRRCTRTVQAMICLALQTAAQALQNPANISDRHNT